MRSVIWALVAVLLVAAAPAFAGGEKGNLELGIYGGYGWLDDYGIFQPKNHLLFGGRLGYWFSSRWSAEISAQRMATHTDFDVVGLTNVDAHLSAYRFNLLYNFAPEKSFRPFLTAGIGKEKIDIDDYGESCDIGWNAGLGTRIFLSPHFNLRLDGRYVHTKVGGNIDESEKNVEATLGLNLLFGGKHKERHAEEVAPAAAPNQPPTVTCAADRTEVLPGESVSIHATASDPEGGPLKYAWSTTAGRVSGDDATESLDFTGATPPATASITVRVTDDHGNTATSDCSVRLIEPVKPAEAVSCFANGFPRNAARLSNVDKACLDDVAQRLSADPQAHVVVIGHSDAKETASAVAQKRADAVKTYLSKERSIDESRITSRSAPADAGADATAQAGNRRVEVWFVPQGASDPK